ncbi:gag-protease polyprotein [Trifolium repens]|nr:gag-protease polyprotein [Trifolium repens]
MSKEETNSEEETEVQCYECEGFGHIRIQCPIFLRKQKKGLAAILSDSEDEAEDEDINNAFSGMFETSNNGNFKCFTNTEDSDEELLYNAKVREQDENIERLIKEHEERASLEKEYNFLKSKLISMTETLRSLNYESHSEDEFLETEKIAEDMIGLGFDHPFKKAESAPEKVARPLQKPKDQISGQKSQHPAQHKERIIDLIDHISQTRYQAKSLNILLNTKKGS